ncbi:MAG: hypothetical protein IJI56_01820 [Firmicutes bacterium]|nr:hypothetical protein [Bacillota bacterium]
MLGKILRIAGIVLIIADFYIFRFKTRDIHTVYQYDKPEDKVKKQEAYEEAKKKHERFSLLTAAGIVIFIISFIV